MKYRNISHELSLVRVSLCDEVQAVSQSFLLRHVIAVTGPLGRQV